MTESEEDDIVARIVAERHQRVRDGVDQPLDDDEFRAAAEVWTRVEGGRGGPSLPR